MRRTSSGEIPPALSATAIVTYPPASLVLTTTSGSTPAFSQASSALSKSSFKTTAANFPRGCPVIFSNSFARK